MRVVAIIQARLGSTRLPGKVLLPLAWQSVLAHVVSRAAAASLVDEVVVATSVLPGDDRLAEVTAATGARLFRGSEHDVLSRYAGAAAEAGADAVVRITADCPLLDTAVLDEVISRFHTGPESCNYASNTMERTYPRGLDVEVFSRAALDLAAREATSPEEREHVTLWFHRNTSRCSRRSVASLADLSRHRWTLDTPEDFLFMTTLFGRMPIVEGSIPPFARVAEFLDHHPDIFALNSGVPQKSVDDVAPPTLPYR